MFRSSKGDIGFVAFLLFLILCIFLIVRPVKADEISKPMPPFPPAIYTIQIPVDQLQTFVDVFAAAEMPQNKWKPVYDNIVHQIGVQNDAAHKAQTDWQTEENKKNAPKK